jgi:hypothetical protein
MRPLLDLCVILGVALILVSLAMSEPKARPQEPVRLCPLEDDAMQWPCSVVPWTGRA